MKLSNSIVFLLFLFFGTSSVVAQVMESREWEITFSETSAKPGEKMTIHFEAEIPDGWYMYSSDFDPEVGSLVTEFNFIENDKFALLGEIQPVGQKRKYDEIWEGEYTYFTETARFDQEVLIKEDSPEFRGSIFLQVCSDVSGQCIPFETDFAFDAMGNSILSTSKEESEIENTGISDISHCAESNIFENY